MKNLILGLALIGSLPHVLEEAQAANQIPGLCNNLYTTVQIKTRAGEDAKDEIERLQACVRLEGESDEIKAANEFKRKEIEREAKIEEMVEERTEVARGQRAGVLQRTLTLEDILNNPRNHDQIHYISMFEVRKKNGDPKEYTQDPHNMCKHLGFDKALSYRQTTYISSRFGRDEDKAPDKIFFLDKINRPVFGGNHIPEEIYNQEPIVLKGDGQPYNRNPSMRFKYYAEITCERNVREGDTVQEFEIDVDAIRAQVESEVKAPEMSDTVRRMLGLGEIVSDQVVHQDYTRDIVDESERRPDRGGFYDDSWEPDFSNSDDYFMAIPQ